MIHLVLKCIPVDLRALHHVHITVNDEAGRFLDYILAIHMQTILWVGIVFQNETCNNNPLVFDIYLKTYLCLVVYCLCEMFLKAPKYEF